MKELSEPWDDVKEAIMFITEAAKIRANDTKNKSVAWNKGL